jgi:molybdopterin-containing oxidoreductase family iron-sulfur binding subunit
LHKKRSIILEATVAQYIANQNLFKEKKHEISSIVPPVEYKEEKWGMVIDLNKCVGCGACVAACNVENNIPVVGEEQVAKSREMHWIRIDRYYSGETENPKVSLQPMLCQHCDNAPCENVCPVVATTHSPDGLNQMAYNRCVGTRYCANNCPYKVRRFNFFNYRVRFADGIYYEEPARLLNNTEFTVRSRGVMEKCNICIQRIMDAREKAIKENRNLRDGDIVTACQSACPADAIVFGNLNDLNSKVSYWNNHNLGYKVLEILNVKPNVTYIAKLRNTTEKIENKEA